MDELGLFEKSSGSPLARSLVGQKTTANNFEPFPTSLLGRFIATRRVVKSGDAKSELVVKTNDFNYSQVKANSFYKKM
jgi:hypothetical protein